jgi:glycosyltransferase involved in cell wall biosynthesis
MKVLFATYPMAFHTPGGGEVQLLAYQKHLQAQGVDVTLLDPWNPRFLEHDIVHFFSCMGGSIPLCHFMKQLGLPLVITSSLWITPENKHLYGIDDIRHQLSLADRIITNSEMETETLSQVLNLPKDKFFAVYNGIDEFFLRQADPKIFREKFGIQDRFVLNVGNVERRKNQLTLVRAMKAFPEFKLVLMGHQREPDYSAEVLAEGGDQVLYLGPFSHDEVLLSAYRACDLFCLPSTLETPGLAALEAAAQGAKLLLTAEGSCPEYFGQHAEYVNPFSVEDLREKIGRMLDSSVHNQSEKFPVEDFLWKNTVGRLKTIYEGLIS